MSPEVKHDYFLRKEPRYTGVNCRPHYDPETGRVTQFRFYGIVVACLNPTSTCGDNFGSFSVKGKSAMWKNPRELSRVHWRNVPPRGKLTTGQLSRFDRHFGSRYQETSTR